MMVKVIGEGVFAECQENILLGNDYSIRVEDK